MAEWQSKNKGKTPAKTVFDSQFIVNALKRAELGILAKVPKVDGNKKLYEQHNIKEDTFLVLAPDGKTVLKSFSGKKLQQIPIIRGLKDFKKDLDKWKKTSGT